MGLCLHTLFPLHWCFFPAHFCHLFILFLSFYIIVTSRFILLSFSYQLPLYIMYFHLLLPPHACTLQPCSFPSDIWVRVRFTFNGTQEAAYFRDGQPAVIYWPLTRKWQSVLLHRNCVYVCARGWLVCSGLQESEETDVVLLVFALSVFT